MQISLSALSVNRYSSGYAKPLMCFSGPKYRNIVFWLDQARLGVSGRSVLTPDLDESFGSRAVRALNVMPG